MHSRERVKKAIHFEKPDKTPIRNQTMEAAQFEHGRKLLDLYKTYPGDFGDPANTVLPKPKPEDIRPDGSYHRIETDIFGVEWEFIKFGIAGHPLKRPLDRIEELKNYRMPAAPGTSGAAFEAGKAAVKKQQETSYCLNGWMNFFEIMHSIRNFEDVLMDVTDSTKEINLLADMILEYRLKEAEYYIALGVDGVMMADDWGTQTSMLIGKDTWLDFFKPRYAKLVKKLKSGGIDVFFHSCGYTLPLLPEFAEIGVDVYWPQMSSNDNVLLAKEALKHKLCLELHMDRQQLMTFGTPEQIVSAVAKAKKTFGNENGGIIWHAEIDNGFPFENIKGLLNAMSRNR